MKMLHKIATITNICLISFGLMCLPETSTAQRFGHGGGGGGGFHGGGGGGFHGGGGGGGFHGGAINGGARPAGRDFRAPAPMARPAYRSFPGGVRTEGVYHNPGFGVRPYFYHPFHPYVWGPYWHPYGFFVDALAADAIFFSIAGTQYYYDQGVYYVPQGGGYSVVAPPVGAVVSYLPAGYETIPMDDGSTYFYYGGAFYVSQGGSFRVVPAPVGAVVTEVPQGATEQVINGQNYLLYNNTYYEPISMNGQDAYQVVQVQ